MTQLPVRPRPGGKMAVVRDAVGGVQSVLVLGGGSDLALATVRRLVADRCRTVVLAARRPEELDAEVDGLRAAGATTVEAVGFDADDATSHAKVVDDVFARHGDIDLVLLAFGVLGDQDRFDHDPAAAAAAATTNFVGGVSAGLAVAEAFRAQGHGTLVVFSSVAGVRVRADNVVYGATKAGLDGFASGLSDRLAGTGARVMVVRPGFVHSKMTEGLDPAPFATTPDVVADAVVDGLRRGADVVWAPAKLRLVFSVLRLLPRPVWRRLSAR